MAYDLYHKKEEKEKKKPRKPGSVSGDIQLQREEKKRFRLETLAPRGNGRLLSYHERQVEKNKNKKIESKN